MKLFLKRKKVLTSPPAGFTMEEMATVYEIKQGEGEIMREKETSGQALMFLAAAVASVILALAILGWPEIDPILDQVADAGRPVEVRR